MYTPHGTQQRKNLLDLGNLGDKMLVLLRPIVEKVPAIITKRVKDTGSGAEGAFSAYNPDYAKKKRKSGQKNFWDTGKMWNSFKIVKESVGDGVISYELGTDAGKANNGQYLSDLHSEERRKHNPGGTQGESQLILGITDEEWEKTSDEMFAKIVKSIVI